MGNVAFWDFNAFFITHPENSNCNSDCFLTDADGYNVHDNYPITIWCNTVGLVRVTFSYNKFNYWRTGREAEN